MTDATEKKRQCDTSVHPPETALTTAYLCALFILLPLCVHNAYRDIRSVKTLVFYALSAVYLAWMLVMPLIRLHRRERSLQTKLSLSDLFFPAFAAVGILGTLISGFGRTGFLAQDNREQGILTFLIYCALFFFIRCYGRRTALLRQIVLFTLVVVCILGILNQLHIDPLGYLSTLREGQQPRFTSTVGNINFYGAYCVLLFPIPYYLLLHAKGKKETLLYAALSTVALLGTVASRTEGAFLGLLATILILPLLCVDASAFKRFVLSLPFLLFALGVYQCGVFLLGGFRLSLLLRTMLSPIPYAVMMVLSLLLALLLIRMDATQILRCKQIYKVVFFSLAVIVAVVFVLINLFFAQDISPRLAKYLVITPEWGTDRGRIWIRAWEILRSFTPLQFFIGGGSGCFARWDVQNRLFSNAVMDTAHNEYLHYMLTHGLLGTGLYISFLISSIARGIKHGGTEGRAIACGCIAYACYATVSFAQTFTTPLFFALLFLLPTQGMEQPEKSWDKRLLLWVLVSTVAMLCLLIGWQSSKP